MYNKAIVMGRLTADPELRQTPNGIPVTSFSIAVNRSFSKGGEQQVDFLDIVAWRQQAEFVCRYFTKGRPILIEGSIQTRQFTDKNGQSRRAWEIVADRAAFTGDSRGGDGGGSMPSEQQHGSSHMAPATPAPAYTSGNIDDFAEIDDDGDLPF